jgi:hypothetical protein
MKYSILLSAILLAGFVLIYVHGVLSNGEIPILFMNSMFKEFNQNIPGNIRIQPGKSPNETRLNEIKQELYDSISVGMTYEQVIAIIGWDGVLIYENNIDAADGKIHEQVYQWNNQNIYSTEDEVQKPVDMSLYGSMILKFQNNILIKKSSLNIKP